MLKKNNTLLKISFSGLSALLFITTIFSILIYAQTINTVLSFITMFCLTVPILLTDYFLEKCYIKEDNKLFFKYFNKENTYYTQQTIAQILNKINTFENQKREKELQIKYLEKDK